MSKKMHTIWYNNRKFVDARFVCTCCVCALKHTSNFVQPINRKKVKKKIIKCLVNDVHGNDDT